MDKKDNIFDEILDYLKDNEVYESRLRKELIQKYPCLTTYEISKYLTYLESHNHISQTRVQYYVLTDHFESKQSGIIKLNKLKCIEVVQKMVDKLKPKQKTSQVAYVISKNLPLSGVDIAKELQRQSSGVYLNLQYLKKIGIIRDIEMGYKGRRTYKITFYGKYAIRSLELQSYFENIYHK